jgi:NAD(P)-dependent dehydrogenase (short-subunit alcohol dehydrogenase family)
MYAVNLGHIFAVTRAFIPSMIGAHSGRIVNIHSVEGVRGYPKDPVYGAMKAAAAHFTTSLAVAMGRHGIRVNGIACDLTQTSQVDYLTGYEDLEHLWEAWAPAGRVGWPDEQARAALFLASDLSSFVTGENIAVDGGTKAGGGWLFSPREGRFVNRSRHL